MSIEMHRECDRDATLRIINGDVAWRQEHLQQAIDQALGTMAILGRAQRLLVAMEKAETVEATCPFEGIVDVFVVGQPGPMALLQWTCPTCGHEHEEVPD